MGQHADQPSAQVDRRDWSPCPQDEKKMARKAEKKSHSNHHHGHEAGTSCRKDHEQGSLNRLLEDIQSLGPGEYHPMQRWLKEDRIDEPFFGFEVARRGYAAHQQ